MAPGRGTVTYTVHRVEYARVEASKYPGRYMIRLGYLCPDRPGKRWVTQFLCLEHPGWASMQARSWFERRGFPIPRTAADALPILAQAPRAGAGGRARGCGLAARGHRAI